MIKKLFFMILGSLLILSACSNNDEKDKGFCCKVKKYS
ncbi:lipoprotein, putative [Staphylococcus petrasii]|uniref:Lipoprotein, putative n=1 Tax=Staphylococcus petrasii TaxID=1276936 RepID=A0A380FWB3_9STAP|nr:lipoprotein, putative [Staphylococcus petrasii]